ncbi:nuclear transport factor 2 family protein [Actinomadura sp. WMMB 499]|uniref:nuclear transport factor 2 family protein n=1 Tax=Actinomadura sp. WMMB 499 TaxID=1219491 RepID=UPI00124598FA|nr:nuclear transport factor 2 family protein [Actinomadura sp. WMMB 499]QFG23335.1 nuclear transport factor 2 family protein [Actinomadura sp. WMMB 499]
MHPFRKAVEAADIDGAIALLADDVVFVSPVAHKPYAGKAITAAILRAVFRVFEDFRYVGEFDGADGRGREHALLFKTRVGDRDLDGCDFIRHDEHGKIAELMVMVRPLSGANALAEAMGAQFDRIEREAAGG